jgi:hypothetical protein
VTGRQRESRFGVLGTKTDQMIDTTETNPFCSEWATELVAGQGDPVQLKNDIDQKKLKVEGWRGGWTRRPGKRKTRGPEDKRTRGQEDQRTKGPEDKRTRGPTDQRTRGPEDQRTKDQRTKGPEDQRTKGRDRRVQH